MVKSLLLVAILANIIYLVYAGRAQSFAQSSAVSSASSSGATSESYASANAEASQYGSNQQAVACSSAAAWASSTSNENQPPPCDSHPVPSCRVNEEWSNCSTTVCRPKTCDDVGFPVACPDLRPDGRCPVKPGCICQEGYVRNSADICIPMTHCPKCGGDPNAISGCGTNCNQLCSNYNKKPGVCTQECMYNSCDCRVGYVFDEIKKICVFPDDCTCMNCTKKHEVYDPCPPFCPMNTCGIDDAAISCVPSPLPGDPNCPPPVCRCENGYYRNDVGDCVRWKHCPRCKGLNEKYDPCPAPCPPQRCDVNIALIFCPVSPKLGDPNCKPGCRCIDDHVRNQTGVCIPRDQCPTCPNKNEVYDACIAPCPPRRCDVDERVIKCAAPPQPGDPSCVAGCRCDDGFYKNSQGDCVPKDECVRCDGPHEYLDCGQPCDNVCATLHEQNQTNCKIFNKKCTEMCYCEKGYARDKNNICIPIEKCDEPRCKGKHEIFSECVQGECRPKYCSQLGFSVSCPRIDPKYCKQGCLCKDGYLRDDDDNCVSVDQCPECGGDCNARAGCGVYCNKRCSDIGKEPKACLEICYENACDCKKGHVLDDNLNKCVRPEQCTQTCGVNEVFNNCTQGGCRPQNCSQLGFPVPCRKIDPKYCKPGCLCKEGFLRDSKRICVPDKQCPPVCKKDEVYSNCINGGCSAKNCSQLGRPVPCIKLDPKYCIKGCLCKDGLLRDGDGKCVPPKDCKNKCNKPNEYYESCDNNCPPRTCESLEKSYACPIREGDTCKASCKCKEGFYRDRKGNCITKEQCQMCNKPNEYYACGGACDNVCSEMHKQNQTSCPIVNIKCNEKCYCDEDYARAKNGTCIPISKCCEPQCGKNERYEKCPAWLCVPQKCSQLGYPVDCPDKTSGRKCPVKPSCVCVDGYLKDVNGTCIPKKNCPSCGGDPNAVSGCGTNCGKRCEDLGKKPGACPKICNINGCDCKDGYYFDKTKGKCVLASECTGICSGKHEVFEDCKNPSCSPKKCSEVGFPLNCTDPPKCNKGCVCEYGYVRSARGYCIPMRNCSSCGGDPNAWSGCGVNCGKKCEDIGSKNRICPRICFFNACDCKDNFYLNSISNKCVPADCCPPKCGENEVVDTCVNGGCGHRNCSQLNGPILCIDPIKCKQGCTCKKGFLRVDATGVCVSEEKCPNVCNKPNEEYVKCPPKCPPQTCESINKTYHCPLMKINETDCTGECRCKKGFYRNLNGECICKSDCLKCPKKHEYFSCGPACDNVCCDLDVQTKDNCTVKNIKCVERCYCEDGYARIGDENSECVPISDCSAPKCGENEVVDTCVNGGCGHRNCSQLNGPMLCIDPIKCKQGCTCKKGYYREDATGVCVPEEKCPNVCNKPNEEYVKCPLTCPPQTCESINKTYHCPLMKINETDCTGECRCKKGFYRNLNGECICESDCLKCPKDHEYFSCGPACDNVCCDLDVQTKDNCIEKNIKCVERCYCEDGYARIGDENSECVPISDCSGCGNPTPKPTVNTTEAIAYFEDGNTLLTISFLKQLLDSRRGENIIFSTYSLMNVLGQLVMSAEGDSLDQILCIMNLDNIEEVHNIFPILIQMLQEQKDVIFQSANKIYGTNKAPFTKSFQRNANIFNAEVQNIDFAQNIEAADIINEWVETETKGLIKDIANPDMFSSLTRMAIFNCLYFRGNWVHQFNPKSTQLRDFYINAKDKVSIQTMYLKATLKYALIDKLNAQALLLPYKGNKFNMLFILPGEDSDLNSLVEQLDPDTIRMIEDSLKLTPVIAYIPRIDVNFDMPDMKDILIKNNLTAIFKASSDFSEIFENKNEKLYVSDIVQKSAIKLDETGTEAASSTGAIITARSQAVVPIQTIFNANRPFILILKYKDSILFCGAIVR